MTGETPVVRGARAGWTLMELVITTGIMVLVMGLSLRMVFLADRAISRETSAATAAKDALALCAHLRDDIRLAEAVSCRSSNYLVLTLPGKKQLEYVVAEGATARKAGQMATSFPNVTADFSGTTSKLVEVEITDKAGGVMELAIHPRNVARRTGGMPVEGCEGP